MNVGDVSNAYQAEDLSGNELSKIVKLLDVIPSHPASLNEDYLTIEEMALNDKQMRVFKDWLTDKIDGIYVYIDPEFRNGEFAEGLEKAVSAVGEKLKAYFPYHENDTNEQPDDISFGNPDR